MSHDYRPIFCEEAQNETDNALHIYGTLCSKCDWFAAVSIRHKYVNACGNKFNLQLLLTPALFLNYYFRNHSICHHRCLENVFSLQ